MFGTWLKYIFRSRTASWSSINILTPPNNSCRLFRSRCGDVYHVEHIMYIWPLVFDILYFCHCKIKGQFLLISDFGDFYGLVGIKFSFSFSIEPIDLTFSNHNPTPLISNIRQKLSFFHCSFNVCCGRIFLLMLFTAVCFNLPYFNVSCSKSFKTS